MDFAKRTLYKITNHLTLREGFTAISAEEASTIKVTDSMGFIYEVSVECVGRIKTLPTDDINWQKTNTRKLSEG